MDRVRELFDAAADFTVGIEEEFAIVDPETRSLTQRFEELRDAAREDDVLAGAVAGELISSEIEIRSGRGATFADAVARQRDARARLFGLAERHGVLLGATGTHPWSPWQEQRIIDTEHYHRVEDGLRYVAWRNNTFSLHVHVGIRGADRAVAVSDRLRAVLPQLLAISANSPFLDGRDSGLASARSQIFTRSFPRAGIPDPVGDFASYADYVRFLVETGSIVESTQIRWSVRPHHAFGTVEVRICDAQSRAQDSEALAGLIAASIAQAALAHDDGVPHEPPPGRLIEENLWRAIRHGLDGRMIDLLRRQEFRPPCCRTASLPGPPRPAPRSGSGAPAGRERRPAAATRAPGRRPDRRGVRRRAARHPTDLQLSELRPQRGARVDPAVRQRHRRALDGRARRAARPAHPGHARSGARRLRGRDRPHRAVQGHHRRHAVTAPARRRVRAGPGVPPAHGHVPFDRDSTQGHRAEPALGGRFAGDRHLGVPGGPR